MGDLKYDYESNWKAYSSNQDVNRRFLSNKSEDLLKICDVYDFNCSQHPRTSAGIPLHFDSINKKMYCLKAGPHQRVSAESGNKKSRCCVRTKIQSCVLNENSFCINDPKGELYSDPHVINLLQENGYNVYCINMREFSTDGINILAPAFRFEKAGQKTEGDIYIEKLLSNLLKNNESKDPFWAKEGQRLIRNVIGILKILLIDVPGGEEAFNLASVRAFIRMDYQYIKDVVAELLQRMPSDLTYNPARELLNVLGAAENTVRSVIISASALIEEFAVCEALLKQISISTFNPREFYQKKSALFFVIPDEASGMDIVASYLWDVIYQELVDEHTNQYRNNPKGAPRDIHFIIDECSNNFIPNLGKKVSISRSRQIFFTIVYQSDDGMAATYKEDWLNIKYNMAAHIFLGNSSADVLKQISEEAGTITISRESKPVPAVSVDELRQMKKTKTYKDALVIVGDYLYAAKLPDYEVIYPTLDKTKKLKMFPDNLKDRDYSVFTPEDLYEALANDEIHFEIINKKEKRKSSMDRKDKDEDSAEKRINELYNTLFGGTEDDS